MENRTQLEEVEPQLPSLELADVRLGFVNALSQLHLCHAGRLPRLTQKLEEDTVLACTGEFFHKCLPTLRWEHIVKERIVQLRLFATNARTLENAMTNGMGKHKADENAEDTNRQARSREPNPLDPKNQREEPATASPGDHVPPKNHVV